MLQNLPIVPLSLSPSSPKEPIRLSILLAIRFLIRNHVIRNLQVDGQKIQGAGYTNDKIPEELFEPKYCYDCKQLSIRKLVKFIAVKCFIEGFPLKLIRSIVSCLNN